MHKMFKYSFLFLALACGQCSGQTNPSIMTPSTTANPLLCTPEACEIPGSNSTAQPQQMAAVEKPVRIIYFTDPICSTCWGIEPQLRRLKLEYGQDVTVEYHMGGLLPQWEGFNGGGIRTPDDVAPHWDEVSHYYQMPIDGDVWLEDPLPSSYPPSIAFKAAQLQDEHKAQVFLRSIREMVFLQKKNITKWEYLAAAAQSAGLDVVKFKADYEGEARQLFQEDLALARKFNVRGFPTMYVINQTNEQQRVYGFKPYAAYETAILQLYPKAQKTAINTDPEYLFAQFPTLTTREFAELSGQTNEAAAEMLAKLQQSGRLGAYVSKNGVMWSRR
jgi:predicted DsbA family dithiol-disulfide isomerase